MSKKFLLIILLATLLKCTSQRQNINGDLSKLFFNVDVTDLNNTLVDKFLSDTSLHKDTVYHPPNNNRAGIITQHIFKFENNKYVKSQFLQGYLGVIIGDNHDSTAFTILYLALSFKTESDLDTVYSQIVERFKKLGKLEIEPYQMQGETAVITNMQYDKRFEIMKALIPPNQHLLYLYLKKSKK